MPEVEQPEFESQQEPHPTPLTPGEVEQLRRGDSSLDARATTEPTYAEKRQRFIEQANALRHKADKAEVEAETLDHVADEMHHLNADAKREEAARLRAEADQVEAATQSDAENTEA